MQKRANFIKLIKFWGITFLIGFGICIIVIDAIVSYRDFNSRAYQMRADHIAHQKEAIKQEVNRVVDLISYEKSQSEILTKEKIKSRVYEAYSIAQHIYQQNKSSKNKAEIQKLILDALRPIRFENGIGYYFATRLDGVEMLFADKPEMEGLDLLEMQDTRGQYVIKDMIKIARQSGEGFYEYQWTKPKSAGNEFKKISFIKRFKPYDWFIGTGLYVDDVVGQIKANLLSTISRIRFDKEGYIFINRLNGDALVSNGKVFSGTEKLWEVFNEDPEKMKAVFDREYTAALKPDGDYIYYSHVKLTTPDKESPKVSFIFGIPDMQWIVGAGVYLDDVETDIALMRAKLNEQIKKRMLYYILTVMGIVALFFLFFNWLNRRLKNDFNLFASFFSRAAHSDREMDRNAIKFIELDQMAEYANKMLTERKQAEETLRKSEEKYKLITETSQTGIYIHQDDVIVYANDRYAQLHGYTVDELIGAHFFNLVHPDDRERSLEIKSKRLRGDTDTPQYHESRRVKKDGEILWCQTVAILIDYQGKPAILGNVVDITERKRAEESLRESEEKYRQLFEVESDAIFLIEKDSGNILEVNASAANLYGYSRDELLRMKNVDLSAEADKTKQATQNQYTQIPVRYHRKRDGTVFPVEITASHLSWKGREVHIAAIRDITFRVEAESARKELEKELFHARKMESIGTLTGGIAHDFNNILGIIVGNTELALDDVPKWNPAHSHLEAIKTACLRATRIVKQLLSFSRKTTQILQPIEIAIVIKDAVKFLRSTIPTTIDIRQHIQVTDETILADPTQINQIMMNLCSNASQAMEQTGGILTINVESINLDEASANSYPDLSIGKHVKITISDTGPGIAPEIIDRIFEPYFTTKEVGKGSGMGLAVVHGIVQNHNGAISVESGPGKGTTFNILFPVAAEKPAIEVKTPEEIPLGNESILFIDDEESIVDMTQRMLERLGYKVKIKMNPVEAFEEFQSNPDRFDLVMTDMTMPKMTGVVLSEKITGIRPDIPVIICTGHSDLVDEKKAKQLGIAAYIMKPINRAEMAKTIRKVLDEAKSPSSD